MAPVVTLGNTWPSLWLSASKNLYAFYKSALLKKKTPQNVLCTMNILETPKY